MPMDPTEISAIHKLLDIHAEELGSAAVQRFLLDYLYDRQGELEPGSEAADLVSRWDPTTLRLRLDDGSLVDLSAPAEQGDPEAVILDDLAGLCALAATDLVAPLDADSRFNWQEARALTYMVPFRHALASRLSGGLTALCAPSPGIVARFWHLADLMLAAPPEDAIVRFLRRVSRCYLAGFDAETTMLCRSVTENAVKLAAGRVAASPSAEFRSEFRSRLELLKRSGHLNEDMSKAAWTIWQRGNKAIHEDPDAIGNVGETVMFTMKLVAQLAAVLHDVDPLSSEA
jgi:hypothetical protein